MDVGKVLSTGAGVVPVLQRAQFYPQGAQLVQQNTSAESFLHNLNRSWGTQKAGLMSIYRPKLQW